LSRTSTLIERLSLAAFQIVVDATGNGAVDFYSSSYEADYPAATKVAIALDQGWTMQTSHIYFSNGFGYTLNGNQATTFNLHSPFVKVPSSVFDFIRYKLMENVNAIYADGWI